ncbi:MAG: Ig-like domain-containing protein [Gammaproteobacteria bacterium]|nr:Ig-like domain-containing protein [Gammaproteobacteria bacterium]
MRYMESLRGRMRLVNGGHRVGAMTANSTGSAAMWNSVGKAVIVLMMLILAGCNEDNAFFDTTGTGTDTETSAESITMLASSPQLGSSGSVSVTITAIVKDGLNNLLAAVPVVFTADSGSLSVIQSITDDSGQAIATLDPGGDFTNRTITVTATTGNLSEAVDVNVTGTSMAISGENSATLGDTTSLIITLTDSDGDPISGKTVTVDSSLGNTLSAASLTTSSIGQATVNVTAVNAGADVITVSSQGATSTHTLAISGDQFQMTAPAANADINLGACQSIQVSWQQNGSPVSGSAVSFSATRGNLFSDAGCTVAATSSNTNGSGVATLFISSTNAGPSTLTAFVSGGPTTSRSVNFVATTPATIALQASPASIGPNDGSQTTQQQSTITAVVRDASNNLVKGKVIRFSIVEDNSGGTLTTATATTDDLGRASTTYVSSAATTAQNGVIIRATVDENTAINTTVSLTVSQSALFVRLGTGNSIEQLGETQYDKKYTVMVTDAGGNAVAGASIDIALNPDGYAKGFYVDNAGR